MGKISDNECMSKLDRLEQLLFNHKLEERRFGGGGGARGDWRAGGASWAHEVAANNNRLAEKQKVFLGEVSAVFGVAAARGVVKTPRTLVHARSVVRTARVARGLCGMLLATRRLCTAGQRELYSPAHHLWVRLRRDSAARGGLAPPRSAWQLHVGLTDRGMDEIGSVTGLTRLCELGKPVAAGDALLSISWEGHKISDGDELCEQSPPPCMCFLAARPAASAECIPLLCRRPHGVAEHRGRVHRSGPSGRQRARAARRQCQPAREPSLRGT